MTALERYVTRNPMKVEARRSFRKFIGMGKLSQAAVSRGSVILGSMYALVMVLLLYLAQYVPPDLSHYLELIVLLGTAGIGFYGSVCGERERRTWDVLRALPITNGQIVVGKFLGGAAVLALLWVAMLPYTLVNAFAFSGLSFMASIDKTNDNGGRFLAWLLSSLVTLDTALFALAFTVFISTRVKRSASALSIVLGALFCWVAVLPMLVASALPRDDTNLLLAGMTFNPFVLITAIGRIADEAMRDTGLSYASSDSAVVFVVGMYLAVLTFLAVGLVFWADRTLTFAEDQVDFVKKKNA